MITTKLLIPEHPLQVLPSLACKIGLNEAMVLQQLHYWLQNIASSNDKKYQERHCFQGRYWRYGTYKEWKDQDFPFWSAITIKRAINSLEKQGLIISDNFNEKSFDRTKWYTINYEAIPELDLPVSRASYQNDTMEELKMTRQQIALQSAPTLSELPVEVPSETTTETTINNSDDYSLELEQLICKITDRTTPSYKDMQIITKLVLDKVPRNIVFNTIQEMLDCKPKDTEIKTINYFVKEIHKRYDNQKKASESVENTTRFTNELLERRRKVINGIL